jgi:hypothetical protein
MTSIRGASREATGALMVAPVGVEEWTAAQPATPDRRMDRVDPRGGVGPTNLATTSWLIVNFGDDGAVAGTASWDRVTESQ